MPTILRFLQLFALGTWTGSIAFVTLLLAPGAFGLLPTRELAGSVVGMALGRLHLAGYALGVMYLAASFGLADSLRDALRPAALLVILMLALTAVNQQVVNPRVADLRTEMRAQHGSVDQTPQDSPLRASFGKLHGVSTLLELAVLLLGLAALFLHVRIHAA